MKNRSVLLFVTFLAFLSVVLIPRASLALDNYFIDTEHTEIQFFYLHGGVSEQSGEFTDFDGELYLDEENPENSSITVEIIADSVNSGITRLDGQLRNPYYLSAKEHPKITFQSTSFRQTGDMQYLISGNLTLRGITKPIDIKVDIVHKGEHMLSQRWHYYKGIWLGIVGETAFLRSEFELTSMIPMISDEIRVEIRGELKMRKKQE